MEQTLVSTDGNIDISFSLPSKSDRLTSFNDVSVAEKLGALSPTLIWFPSRVTGLPPKVTLMFSMIVVSFRVKHDLALFVQPFSQ